MIKQTKLIFSLDVDTEKDFLYWLDKTKDNVDYYKIGLVPYCLMGPKAVEEVKKRGKKVFLDLKFHDIPNTMIKAASTALEQEVDIIDLHLCNDEDGLTYTAAEIKRISKEKNKQLPLIIGITVLTSSSGGSTIKQRVEEFALKSQRVGFSGVVLSGQEAPHIRKICGRDIVLICPGIRLEKTNDDQKRVVTPKDVKGVADFIVVGRPILNAKEPDKVISRINSELK